MGSDDSVAPQPSSDYENCFHGQASFPLPESCSVLFLQPAKQQLYSGNFYRSQLCATFPLVRSRRSRKTPPARHTAVFWMSVLRRYADIPVPDRLCSLLCRADWHLFTQPGLSNILSAVCLTRVSSDKTEHSRCQ